LLGVGLLLGSIALGPTGQLAAQGADAGQTEDANQTENRLAGGELAQGADLAQGGELAQGVDLAQGADLAQADSGEDDPGQAIVAKVSGLLDPVTADYLFDALRDAQESEAVLLVLQIDSRGAVISNSRLQSLADEITNSSVPVVSWIGTSGAKAYGKVAQLVAFTERVGIAPGARIGRTGEDVLQSSTAGGQALWGPHAARLRNSSVSTNEALELGITNFQAPTVGDFLVGLDEFGFQSVTTFNDDNEPRLEPLTTVQFVRLSALDQLFHTVASPPIAYVLLLVGLWLFAFEFFSAGVGIAGATGALSLLLSSYGLVILPLNWWGIVLIVLAMLAYCIDAQVGVPRFWTVVGTGALVWGTIILFDGTNGADMSWIPMSLGTLGVLLGMIWVMPVVIRSRFSTPTIGREWMIGEEGEAIEAIDPEGVIKIRGTLWRARARRAATIAPGEKAVVEELVGLTLMVEPKLDDKTSDNETQDTETHDDETPDNETHDDETPDDETSDNKTPADKALTDKAPAGKTPA